MIIFGGSYCADIGQWSFYNIGKKHRPEEAQISIGRKSLKCIRLFCARFGQALGWWGLWGSTCLDMGDPHIGDIWGAYVELVVKKL